MRHNYQIEGFAFRLRPVLLEDAEFIVETRTRSPQRTRYLHVTSPRVEDQRDWILRYFNTPDDYYWVIERQLTHAPEGLVGIYNVDRGNNAAEWGRWILREGSLAAVESVYLVFCIAFEQMNLNTVYSRTVVDNHAVVSFHDSCGWPRNSNWQETALLNDGAHDLIRHDCRKELWTGVKATLEPQARRFAQKLGRPL